VIPLLLPPKIAEDELAELYPLPLHPTAVFERIDVCSVLLASFTEDER